MVTVELVSIMPWVYILECRDGSYYTGSTPDLERRIAEHQSGTYEGYTCSRRPVRLVFCYETAAIDDAFQLERQIKGWSRAKKEALIAGQYDLLPTLARCYGKRGHGEKLLTENGQNCGKW